METPYYTREQYLDKCKELCGDNCESYSDEYSFAHAYQDGLTPEQAIKDCKEWLGV